MIDWTLTDLRGNPLGAHSVLERGRPEGSFVKIPLNDGRTASAFTTIWDPILTVPDLRPLKALLKASYKGHRVFGGVIQIPGRGAADGRVELQAVDPSRRLDAAPLLDPRVKWSSIDQLVEAARPLRYGYPDAPDHGVRAYPGVTAIAPPPYDPRYNPGGLGWNWIQSFAGGRGPMPVMELSAGQSAWAAMKQAADSVFGPDFLLQPIEHIPGSWDYTELVVANRIGRELQNDPDVVFHVGWGRNNCIDATFSPDGTKVVNAYFAEVGQAEDGKAPDVAGYYSPPEINDVGFYAGYEGSSGCSGAAGGAITQVVAYRDPPRFFTFQPAIEGDDGTGWGYVDGPAGMTPVRGLGIPPRVLDQYDVGDTIRVLVNRGYFVEDLVGRITDIELREVDKAGNVQVTVTAAPRVNIDGIDSDLSTFSAQ